MVLVACDDPPPPLETPRQDLQTISGSVVFRERIGLTSDARLEITLLDVTGPDRPAEKIATAVSDNPGQSPIDFSLEYDAGLIDEQHRYEVSARVFDRDRLILVSETAKAVLTDGAGSEIVLYAIRVSQSQ